MRIAHALCQDCLRPVLASFDANEVAACPSCKGDCCDCPDCMWTLSLLQMGERRPSVLGLTGPFSSWSAAGGVVP